MIEMIEIGATIFGLIQGVLLLKNSRYNWIAYICQMLLMIVFSYSVALYGDMINSSVYIVVGIVGWILWNDRKELKITSCSYKERIIYIFGILVGTVLFGLYLKSINDSLPFIDAFTTVSGIVATYYTLRRRIDTWLIWFINDIFYIIAYALLPDQAIYLLTLNLVWTFMAVASYINWKKIMEKEVL
ncbi:MAG: nicotinamide riboside transporter PnuC [Mycoplasmatota bacterium]